MHKTYGSFVFAINKTIATFVKNFNMQNRPKIIELLKKYFYKEIYIFKNRNDADEFISQLEKKM